MNEWIKDLPTQDTVISTALKGDTMEPTGTRITQEQKPELYVAIDLEKMSKGGYKKTLKVSVRVFNGDLSHAERLTKELLASASETADEQIRIEEGKDNDPSIANG